MALSTRREFMKQAPMTAGLGAAAPASVRGIHADSPNERVNAGVIGFDDPGQAHYRALCKIPSVRVTALCNVDERLFPAAAAEVERAGGSRPKAETEGWKAISGQYTPRPGDISPAVVSERAANVPLYHAGEDLIGPFTTDGPSRR